MTKNEKRRRRRQRIARDKITTAPKPQPPNAGTQTMTTAPTTPTPNAGTQTMTTPPNTPHPEKNQFAVVVQVRANTHNAITGKASSTVWSIQNPDGTYWTNRRGRRRAWNSRESADAARYNETDVPRPAPGQTPTRYSDAPVAVDHHPEIPTDVPDLFNPDPERVGIMVPTLDHPSPERVGKLVAAAIAIDPRIARQVMEVVSSMIRRA